MQADFKITFRKNPPRSCPWQVIEGSGMVREVVSAHKTEGAAHRAAAGWKAPARMAVLNRLTGEVFDVDRTP